MIIFCHELLSNTKTVFLYYRGTLFDLQGSMKQGTLIHACQCIGRPILNQMFTFTNLRYSSTFLPTGKSFMLICLTTCLSSTMNDPL